jgi:hypothetical protein
MSSSFFGATLDGVPLEPQVAPRDRAGEQAASREETQRQMARDRALSGGAPRQRPAPQLRAPDHLGEDFAERSAKLDGEILARGVAIDREKLIALGKKQFQDLLSADCEARSLPHVMPTDYTRWESVHHAFARAGALNVSIVPRRKTIEIFDGLNLDREAARSIDGFADLWKASPVEPQSVRNVYRFRDVFDSLMFGHKLLELVGSDGRVYSRFFIGGEGEQLRIFEQWLPVFKGPLAGVQIQNVLFSLVSWLANEQHPAPDEVELARNVFNVRGPTREQLQYIRAVVDGFLRGLNGWDLWQHIGRAIRAVPDKFTLDAQRKGLNDLLPAIADFYRRIESCFFVAQGNVFEAYRRFDRASYRRFVDSTIDGFLGILASLVALEVEENFGRVIARLENWILFEPPPKAKAAKFPGAKIEARLKEVFPGATFNVQVSEEIKQ